MRHLINDEMNNIHLCVIHHDQSRTQLCAARKPHSYRIVLMRMYQSSFMRSVQTVRILPDKFTWMPYVFCLTWICKRWYLNSPSVCRCAIVVRVFILPFLYRSISAHISNWLNYPRHSNSIANNMKLRYTYEIIGQSRRNEWLSGFEIRTHVYV